MKVSTKAIPTVVFHGTNFDFEGFDSKRLGLSCNNPTTGFGHFFSDNQQEAISWAFRANTWRRIPENPILVSASIVGLDLFEMSAKNFSYYLQVARGDTIHRHLGKWLGEGLDGFRVKLKDMEWFCVFDPAKILILERRHYKGPEVERVSEMLTTPVVVAVEKIARIPRIILDEPQI